MDITHCCPPAGVLPSATSIVHPCTPVRTLTRPHHHTIKLLHFHKFALPKHRTPTRYVQQDGCHCNDGPGWHGQCSQPGKWLCYACWCASIIAANLNSIAHCHSDACAEPSLLRLLPHRRTQQQLWSIPDEVMHRLPPLLWRRPDQCTTTTLSPAGTSCGQVSCTHALCQYLPFWSKV